MGRPIKKIFIGERGVGGTSGDAEGLASVNLGGVNNSTGYTDTEALTISAPDLVGGVQAEGTVTIETDGELTEGLTTFTAAGLEVDEVASYPGVTGTGGTGTGAVFTIAKAGGTTDYSDLTITVTTPGSGYTLADEIVILGTALGGTTAANDLTLTVTDFVTDGTIASTTVTVAGDGYTSIPTVSAETGTQGTLTMDGVLTTTNTSVIDSTAFIPVADGGTSAVTADMKAQRATRTYRVTTAQGTGECKLVDKAPGINLPVAGEMIIIATDSGGNTYYVTKLMNRTVILTQRDEATTYEFAENAKVKWGTAAIANDTVKITQ